MKNILTLLFTLCLIVSYSQEKSIVKYNSFESKITSLKFTVNSTNEFKIINWEEIKEIFADNKADELISLEFEIDLKEDIKNEKSNVKFKFKVKGETEDIDNLIYKAKKGVKFFFKMSNNLKKKTNEN